MSLLLLFNGGVGVPAPPAVIVGGKPARPRKRKVPEWTAVQTLTRDLLGPEPGSGVPEWQRSEEDLATLILADYL